ncbi:NAD(+) kinase [Aestuariirhabdus litorea]|uniref:NAD kinase n=1 Tax=Aestuariirhabdus litorea TaxID=2528527 RepID=A0A3P3VQM5_9GAMM|nr:NAD(+) kinase [Aestuariirhabdus litorea]RRJ84627.1 NAD(+) kinase [Aestuariirhabdus litorea]RWW97852.1 NAD(+) kinase [Endozoicomonadaceae bacterium GTF-13]
MEQFRNVGVIGRLGGAEVVDTLIRLLEYLDKRDLNIILEQSLVAVLPERNLQSGSYKMLGEVCDLVIVVGGDGSLLGAARELARSNVPVLGVNRGRLGFLTDISPDEIDSLIGEVLDGRYILESRFLLDVQVKRNGEPTGQGSALNDVVLNPGKSARMIEFELYIEGQFVYSQRSDGMIVASPTGSTAYALSAGGPIMHPKLDAMVLVPMFPHTLSSRPIVVDGNSEIKIVIGADNEVFPQVNCDGQEIITTRPGDTVTIHKKPHKLKLIHPLNHNFYEICRSKLGWSSRPGS